MIKVFFSKKSDKVVLGDFSKKEVPIFASYSPDINYIKRESKKYVKYENIIIAARGGSITSFKAYFGALKKNGSKKNVYFIDTADPDYLHYVKKTCSKSKTIVIVISKSGKTIDVIENYLYFDKYDCIFVTSEDGNPMHKIAQKKNIPIFPHPEVGGRYSGLTATALLPACLVGIGIDKVLKGALKGYKEFSPRNKNNIASKVAHWINENDKNGFVDIYMPIYSSALNDFAELSMQLIHESVGKDGKGPTLVPVSAPESQHHSNQRYFGGRKNMQGLFVVQENFSNSEIIKVPSGLKDIELRNYRLEVIDGLSMKKAMNAEFLGSFNDSKIRNIPAVALSLREISEEGVGYFTAFLHYLTVYLCWLNNVNPFDQPEVETSKEISFKKRIS